MELADNARTNVTSLKHRVLPQFLLDAEVVGHRVRVVEIGIDARLIEQTWVSAIGAWRSVELRDGARQERKTNATAARITSIRVLSNYAGGGKRRRRHRIQHDVEERRIISNTEAAANYRAPIGKAIAQEVKIWRPGEANARRPVVLVQRKMRCCTEL